MKNRLLLLCAIIMLFMVSACSQEHGVMHNGYYSAAAATFNSEGWKDFITLYIYNNKIVTVEYNARNASGLILSWDVQTMRRMKARMRIHPSRIIREYTQELLNRQSPETIRRIPGDGYFYENFTQLAAAALAHAYSGDKTLAEVPLGPPASASQ